MTKLPLKRSWITAIFTGELKSFPDAKIYVNAEEVSADELQGIENIVPVNFTDGAYYNFPECQKIGDGIIYIRAKGLCFLK